MHLIHVQSRLVIIRFSEERLANIRSAIKRNRQNKKRRARNRIFRGEARTFVRQANTAIAEGDTKIANEAVKRASSALDKAASKGVIHKNNAARRKGAIMRNLAGMKSK